MLNGTFVYDRYLPGLESQVLTLSGTASKSSQYTQLAILRYQELDPGYDVYNNFTLGTVLLGERENPSGSNQDVADISPFLNAGKKLVSRNLSDSDAAFSAFSFLVFYLSDVLDFSLPPTVLRFTTMDSATSLSARSPL